MERKKERKFVLEKKCMNGKKERRKKERKKEQTSEKE